MLDESCVGVMFVVFVSLWVCSVRLFMRPTKTQSGHHSLLLRLTDDFLFMTTDRDAAVSFGRTLHRGIPEFGCFVNARKSVASFPLVVTVPEGELTLPQPHDGLVPWCGLLFNPQTGEVYANYSR